MFFSASTVELGSASCEVSPTEGCRLISVSVCALISVSVGSSIRSVNPAYSRVGRRELLKFCCPSWVLGRSMTCVAGDGRCEIGRGREVGGYTRVRGPTFVLELTQENRPPKTHFRLRATLAPNFRAKRRKYFDFVRKVKDFIINL